MISYSLFLKDFKYILWNNVIETRWQRLLKIFMIYCINIFFKFKKLTFTIKVKQYWK